MAYYLSKERNEDIRGSYLRYQAYLQENKPHFPPGAYSLGSALWWQLPDDPRCPHDARLQAITIAEQQIDSGRVTTIHIRLRGAYGNGFIDLIYPQVYAYDLKTSACGHGLGDWLYDEFTLSPRGNVIHEIEWAGFPTDPDSVWNIEASDIEFRWTPDS